MEADIESVKKIKSLWRSLGEAETDEATYNTLKEILQLAVGAKGAGKLDECFTPAAVAQLATILEERHGTQVYVMAVALIAFMSSSEQWMKFILRKDIPKHLVNLYTRKDINLDPHSIEGQLEGQLFEHLSSLLLFFSATSSESKDAVIYENIIAILINFLCPFSPLYQYMPEAKTYLKKLTLRKTLRGNVTVPNDRRQRLLQNLRDAYLKTDTTLLSKLKLNHDFYTIELQDDSGLISDRMASAGYVLKRKVINKGEIETETLGEYHESGNDSMSSEGSASDAGFSGTQEVMVTAVANAEYFWACVGGASIREAELVQDAIQSQPEAERIYLSRPPVPGAFVCGCHELRGCYRAQVLSSDDVIARIFALDYGVVVKIPWQELFFATTAMNLGKIAPQARLCRLKDIQPKPVSGEIVDYCLSTLCNLANHRGAADKFLNGNNILSLVRLANAMPGSSAQCKVFRLLCNLCQASDIVQLTLADLGIVQTALAALKRASRSYDSPSSQSVITSAAALLGNLIADCAANKDLLQEERGLEVLLPLVADKVPVHARAAVLKTLRIYISQGKLAATPQTTFRPMQERRRRQSDGKEGINRNSRFSSPEREGATSRDYDSAPDSPLSRVSALYSPSKRAQFESSLPGSLHPVLDSRRSRTRSKSRDRTRSDRSSSRTRRTGHGLYLRQARIDSDEENGDCGPRVLGGASFGETKSNEEDIRVVNTADLYKESSAQDRYYIIDDVVQFEVDQTHEIRTVQNVDKISVLNVAKIICSFLNGRGGTIYFGITGSRVVRGMKVDRDQRDGLRQGVNKIVSNNICPMLHDSQCDVMYVPVVRRLNHEDPKKRMPFPNTYVIEIHLRESAEGQLYTTNDGTAFIRYGDKSRHATSQDIHELAIHRKESSCLREIQDLEKDIAYFKKVIHDSK